MASRVRALKTQSIPEARAKGAGSVVQCAHALERHVDSSWELIFLLEVYLPARSVWLQMILKVLSGNLIPHHWEGFWRSPSWYNYTSGRTVTLQLTEIKRHEKGDEKRHSCTPDRATLVSGVSTSSLQRKGLRPHDLESSLAAKEIDGRALNLPTELWFHDGKENLYGRWGHLGNWNTFFFFFYK